MFLDSIFLFVYTCLGMKLFHDVCYKEDGIINENTNFKDFYSSIITLNIITTGEGWNSFMHDTMTDKGFMASFYWTSFVVIKVYILLNVVVAVIFEKLELVTIKKSISGDMVYLLGSISNFTATWEKFDPEASYHIPTKKLPAFLMKLKAPLGVGDAMLNKKEK